MEALRDRLHAEVLGARSVHVHVPPRDQRHLLRGRRHAERMLPLAEVAQAAPAFAHGRPPWFGSAPYDAAFDRLRDRNATTHSAVPLATAIAARPSSDAAPPPPEGVRAMKRSSGMPSVVTQLDLGDLLDVVAHETVDRGDRQAGVGARGADRLAREVDLGAAHVLRVAGLADPGDGRARHDARASESVSAAATSERLRPRIASFITSASMPLVQYANEIPVVGIAPADLHVRAARARSSAASSRRRSCRSA